MTPIITIKDANAITAGVSQTEKMPCKSWSIPVFMCNRGQKLANVPGSVCSKCYADKGNYHMYRNNIEPAQVARMFALYDNPELWAQAIARLIGSDSEFRWFDAGDLQDVLMLEAIVRVCELTPHTEHWLPTREYEIVAEFIAKHGAAAIPHNLRIRLSALMIDQPVKIPGALRNHPRIKASEVHSKPGQPQAGSIECGAYKNNNKCGDCRMCWGNTRVISYLAH